MFSHISHHLETHKVLCEEQHGSRPNRSCETQLISTINDFAECLNQGGQCDVLLLDFSRAFDKVPHTHLCNMEFMVHLYSGFKLFYTVDLST